jgi:sugar phosphate isomerase/epimerase
MRLSVQLFTLRDAMASDLEGTLAALQDMGLEYVELAGTYGKPANEFAEILSKYDLNVSGSHIGIEGLEHHLDEIVAENKVLGNEWVIVPYISEDRRNWAQLAQTLSDLGEKISADGLRLAYHNHDFEMGLDRGLRTLIAHTHPSLVSFQVDLGWVRFAGEDPAKFIWELGPRAPLVHLKDMAPGCENPHVVAGDGAVHWDEVLAACEATDVQFGSIEMDHPPNDPIDDVRKCVRYFQDRGLS